MEIWRLRRLLAGLALPAWPDGRIRLGADVSNWLRPDAHTSPERLYCHVHGRGENAGQMIPGWPCSFVAALGPGRPSWAVPLDAVRLCPGQDVTEVTAAQLRAVVVLLTEAGQWRDGDPLILVLADAGYSGSRLAWLLRDLPVIIVTRVRPDRVFCRRAAAGTRGRPGLHGAPVRCGDPATWQDPDLAAGAQSSRHGPLAVTAWAGVHQKIHRACGGWDDWPPGQESPLIEGTLIRLAISEPGPYARYARLEPVWIWASDPAAGLDEHAAAVLWQGYLRRSDIEHMFRFFKSGLGWDKPVLRDPAAADRRTWLVITAYCQLRLARDLTAGIRLPWQRPQPGPAAASVMTPGQVRAGFRVVRQAAGTPASSAKPARPGPGRPPGSKNKRKAPRQRVGKTVLKPHSSDTKRPRKEKKSNMRARQG
jgi:hypothetical protein